MSEFECCKTSTWILIADLGHAYSFDVMLGKCNLCGKDWANVFCTASGTIGYEYLKPVDAQQLLSLCKVSGAERKAALKIWIDENL